MLLQIRPHVLKKKEQGSTAFSTAEIWLSIYKWTAVWVFLVSTKTIIQLLKLLGALWSHYVWLSCIREVPMFSRLFPFSSKCNTPIFNSDFWVGGGGKGLSWIWVVLVWFSFLLLSSAIIGWLYKLKEAIESLELLQIFSKASWGSFLSL